MLSVLNRILWLWPLLSFYSIVCLVLRVGGRGGLSPVSLPDSPGTHDNAVWMDCWAPWDCPLPGDQGLEAGGKDP